MKFRPATGNSHDGRSRMSKRPLVLVLLVGCGGTAEEPPTGAVTIAVTRVEGPVPDATVVFHGADGEVLSTGTTDETGRITGEIGLPGAVTVVDPDDPLALLTLTEVTAGPDPIEVPLAPPIDLAGQ